MIALWHRLPDQFEEQLAAIAGLASAYHFDDGYDDVLRAADALETHDLRGVFFVTTQWVAQPGFATYGQLRELTERGHEIGNHTATHRQMPRLSGADQLWEIATAQMALGAMLGREPRRFAWPFGLHDTTGDKLAAGFGFVEARDIDDVLQSAAAKTPAEVLELFRTEVAA